MLTGRRTKCTPETIKAIADNIILGLSNRDACLSVGISEATFYGWMQRGEAELRRIAEFPGYRVRKREQPFVKFLETIRRIIPERINLHIEQNRQILEENDSEDSNGLIYFLSCALSAHIKIGHTKIDPIQRIALFLSARSSNISYRIRRTQ